MEGSKGEKGSERRERVKGKYIGAENARGKVKLYIYIYVYYCYIKPSCCALS